MNAEILTKLGLNDNQITVYTALLREGPSKAGSLSKKTPLKRGLVYKTLEELIELSLVQIENPQAKVITFVPAHPNTLKDLGDKRLDDATSARAQLDHELGNLISQYNLVSGKPGVEFYEGEDGIRKVLWDSLTAKETILTYVDIEAIEKNIAKINKEYSTLRDKKNIQKRGIVLDSPFAQEILSTYHSQTTISRVISAHDAPPFTANMQIYDGKISYITFKENIMVGVIIQDDSIYTMHKYLFEFAWSKARSVFPKDS